MKKRPSDLEAGELVMISNYTGAVLVPVGRQTERRVYVGNPAATIKGPRLPGGRALSGSGEQYFDKRLHRQAADEREVYAVTEQQVRLAMEAWERLTPTVQEAKAALDRAENARIEAAEAILVA